MQKYFWFIFLFFSLSVGEGWGEVAYAQTIEQSLNSDKVQWKFYCVQRLQKLPILSVGEDKGEVGNEKFLKLLQGNQRFPAKVPGTIHLDLLDNKLIPDPFYADNEKRLQWIDTLDWVYETTFDVDSNLFKQNNIELQFDGLDTYADVYLNDEKIITADNMFMKWGVDFLGRDYLQLKNNHLKIVFHSTQKEAKKRADCFRKNVKMGLPEMERVFVRKAQYQFGWDFAPKFLGCGIWRSVKLISLNNFNEVINQHLEFQIKKISNDTAYMSFFGLIPRSIPEIPEGKNRIYFKVYQDTKEIASGIDSLKDIFGRHNDYFGIDDFTVAHPNLWWCNGEGKPNFTKFIVAVSFDGKNYTNHEINVGIKTSEFVHQKDSIGESFYFKLNGKPIFIKGANWVPADVFLPRVTHEKYRNLLTAAKDAGMNMLRIWGGGIYEDDYFYHLCDSLGIMVWQDMMYACAPYPFMLSAELKNLNFGYSACFSARGIYLLNEWLETFNRINIHPCITLICGNNEIEEGWNNWGWKEQLYKSDSIKAKILKQNMDEVFNNIWAPNYIPSSPKFGWGHKESLTDGDSHYWGVWWGMEPYEIYKKRVPRFASEYGMQSLPCLETIRKFAPDSSLRINSVALRNHQKHPTGFENLDGYLKYYGFKVNGGLVKGRKVISEYGKGNPDAIDSSWSAKNYPNPTIKEFEDYINATQQLQADALKTAIEAHMKAQTRCMGTIIWQLNDCWPGASWSLIDYYGNKKKAYYEVQKLFAK